MVLRGKHETKVSRIDKLRVGVSRIFQVLPDPRC